MPFINELTNWSYLAINPSSTHGHHQSTSNIPNQACRANPEVRKQVAAAIINAITNNDIAKAADIPTQNVVVRFSEA